MWAFTNHIIHCALVMVYTDIPKIWQGRLRTQDDNVSLEERKGIFHRPVGEKLRIRWYTLIYIYIYFYAVPL